MNFLPVVEIFYSLQGEGRYVGYPSVFIRLGGCNLKCPSLPCDTIRAVDMQQYADSWIRYQDANSILKHIDSVLQLKTITTPKHIVITGGEPTIHFKNPIFIKLAELLVEKGFLITIETNATIELDFLKYDIYKSFIYSMSVKLSNSGESKNKRFKPSVINSYTKFSKESYLKFVINSELIIGGGLEELSEIISSASESTEIYCMPSGTNRAELEKEAKSVFEFCMSHSFRYSDRIHIRVYDNKDGV